MSSSADWPPPDVARGTLRRVVRHTGANAIVTGVTLFKTHIGKDLRAHAGGMVLASVGLRKSHHRVRYRRLLAENPGRLGHGEE